MAKFDPLRQKFLSAGITDDNIDYAIAAVRNGTRREIILESLTADYRGMKQEQANALLNDRFVAGGGEFRKENRGGYLYGFAFLFAGLICSFYIVYVLLFGGVLIKPFLLGP